MEIEETITKSQRVKLSKREIEAILRDHLVKRFGDDWNNAVCYLQQQVVPAYMGQIEDEYEIVAIFKWTDSVLGEK